MKKGILLFLIFIIIFSCNNYSNQKNDLQKLNLKGEVFKITEFTIDNSNDTIKKTIKVFNKNGFVKKFEVYLKNEISQRIEYKYNNSNQLIEELHYNNSNKLFLKIFYNYNIEHIEVRALNDKDVLVSKITINLDSNKHLINEEGWYYFDRDSLYYDANYIYKNNILTQKDMTNSDSLLNNTRIEYIGNIKGFPEEIRIFNSKGDELNNYTYSYDFDKIGNWINKTEFNGNDKNLLYKRIYEYY